MKDPIKNWVTQNLIRALLKNKLGEKLSTEDLKEFWNGC